jgi:hypothetical protein
MSNKVLRRSGAIIALSVACVAGAAHADKGGNLPGGSLFGLQEGNPVNPEVAYRGPSSDYGSAKCQAMLRVRP